MYATGYIDIEILEEVAAHTVIESEECAANPLTRAWERLSIYLSDDMNARQAGLDALSQGMRSCWSLRPAARRRSRRQRFCRHMAEELCATSAAGPSRSLVAEVAGAGSGSVP